MLAASACRSGGSVATQIDAPLPPDLERCEDRYEAGKIVDYSAEGDFGKACEQNGQLVTPIPVDLTCADGRRLLANRFAWGYQGDEMTPFTPDDTVRLPPDDEIGLCLQEPEGEDESGTATAP